MASFEEYGQAAELLWGDAGRYAAGQYRALNERLFSDSMPPLPIVIGLTAYGGCLGLTRSPAAWRSQPRITLAPGIFTEGGELAVTDVLIHEMTHAWLMLHGDPGRHSHGNTWCARIREVSPAVLGHEITAEYVGPRRVPNPARERDPQAPKTIVIRKPREGYLTQPQISGWPGSLRPRNYGRGQRRIYVETY